MSFRTGMLPLLTWTFLLAVTVFAHPAAAQTGDDKIALLADAVQFDPITGQLSATGNVEIFFRKGVLRTGKVVFYQDENRIEVSEPLILNSQREMTLAAASAIFDLDLENALIKGAQVLLQEQFQFASAEYQRTSGRFNIFNEAVASSCFICEENETPFWQIRAKRIVHDEQEKRIYFEQARMEFLGFPIFYAPRLRIPDPSVRRATGFLVPRFSTSNTLGYGVKAPYFITFGDHADLTLTPFLSSKETAVLEAEYRQMFSNGGISIGGAVALADPLSGVNFRSFLTADGEFRLRRGYKLTFGVDITSDDDFRTQYGFGDEDRLSSFVDLARTTTDSYFSVGASRIQSLRSNEIDEKIPVVLPEFYYRKRLDDPFLGGVVAYQLNSVTLLRESNNEFLRVGGGVSWRRNWQSAGGLVGSYYGALSGNFYSTHNHIDYGTISESEVIPLLATEISWPLAKQVGQVTHVIEPLAQLIWSPDKSGTLINEDSDQVEFEEANLFSYNRFPGYDQTERGLRLNLGVAYKRYNTAGWSYGATIGRVFRYRDLGQFDATNTSGLSGKTSDYVSSVYLSFPEKFDLINSSLFDDEFAISKNETQVRYTSGKWDAAATYVWLKEDVILNQSDKQHEIHLDVDYLANRNWTYSADWRQNLNSGKAIEGELGVRYKNECVDINFSLSLEFAASGIADPKREFGLTVALAGLGNRRDKSNQTRRCAF
jgi:LPS-assembly protein